MEINEEWNNFMHRVNEVSSLVKDLCSDNKEKSDKASVLAGKYLGEGSKTICDFENNLKMKVVSDRTVINKEALRKNENPDQMDPDVWMREMSKDAAKRAADKKDRKERADTFKRQAVRAFKKGEYEKALALYDEAIGQIKDNSMLYNDRALTNIKLGNYEQVLPDVDWALRCNENSYKARLYRAKAYQMLNKNDEFHNTLKELNELYSEHKDLTEFFLRQTDEQGEGDN